MYDDDVVAVAVVCMCMCMCMCMCIYVYMYVCMCVCTFMYVCMYVYMYVCVCMYVNISLFCLFYVIYSLFSNLFAPFLPLFPFQSCLYDRSLFERLFTCCPDAVHFLNTQYRMHKDIALFPSTQFYNGRLLNDASVENRYD